MTTKTYTCHVLNCDCAGAMHGRVETVIAEFDTYGGWDVMWSDGTVDWYPTPAAVKRAVKRRDAMLAEKVNLVVTRLEWRNVPAGFVDPDDRLMLSPGSGREAGSDIIKPPSGAPAAPRRSRRGASPSA